MSRWAPSFLFLFLGLFVHEIPANGQALSCGADNSGPPLEDISAVVIDPRDSNTVYAAMRTETAYKDDYGRVYKTCDGGQSWTVIPEGSGLPAVHVRALAIDPANSAILYAGTRYNGIFKSTDGGKNWTPANSGLTSPFVQALAIDPVNSSILYAGTRDAGIFKSSDSGETWVPVNSGLTSFFVQVLAIDPANPATVYAGTRASFFVGGRSTGGLSKAPMEESIGPSQRLAWRETQMFWTWPLIQSTLRRSMPPPMVSSSGAMMEARTGGLPVPAWEACAL